jgi:hypothetical protein
VALCFRSRSQVSRSRLGSDAIWSRAGIHCLCIIPLLRISNLGILTNEASFSNEPHRHIIKTWLMPNVCAHQGKNTIMTKINNNNQCSANVEYVAYIANEDNKCREHLINRLAEEEVTKFVKNIEQHTPRDQIEIRDFSLLKSIFHGAPVIGGFLGPIYGDSPDREKVSLNYIHYKLLNDLDCSDDLLLQGRNEVEEVIRTLIKGHSDDGRLLRLGIPSSFRQELMENGQRLLSEYKRSGQRLDLKPVVKLYSGDGAGTWLLSGMYEGRWGMAWGLCDQGGGHTVTKAISLSDLEGHACVGLFNIELD